MATMAALNTTRPPGTSNGVSSGRFSQDLDHLARCERLGPPPAAPSSASVAASTTVPRMGTYAGKQSRQADMGFIVGAPVCGR
jgi:hypothetical protein